VVVPIHNVERYLGACLDSLVAQTERDFEAILVDDGSPDRSAEIAADYAARDPRLRLVRQRNGGLGNARNTGIELASGEFLSFLDSDDCLTPDALELLLRSLDRSGSDFATGNILRFDAQREWQCAFVRKAFLRPRRRAHVTSCRFLLADRMAQNKLW